MKRASIFPIRSEKVNLKFYEGDVVLVQVNESYSYELEIRKIEKTTDEGNDKIRSF